MPRHAPRPVKSRPADIIRSGAGADAMVDNRPPAVNNAAIAPWASKSPSPSASYTP